MKKCRQLHLWIGLLSSVLILIEAITGLLLSEPGLMGVHRPSPEQHARFERPATGEVLDRENSPMAFVKNLHAGRIGNTDVSFLLDIAAVGLIILTITGIILSIRALRIRETGGRRQI